MEEVVLWAQLTSVQVTGSYITSLSFGFLVRELSSQHPSCVKRAPAGRSALQMDPLLVLLRHLLPPLPLAQLPDELSHSCLSDSPPKYRLAH